MKHKKFFGTATDAQTIFVQNFNGEGVHFDLPFEVEVGRCVMVVFTEVEDEFIEPTEE